MESTIKNHVCIPQQLAKKMVVFCDTTKIMMQQHAAKKIACTITNSN